MWLWDLSNLFRSVVKTSFPNAQIVADKFHVCRLANWAMEAVRKDVQKDFRIIAESISRKAASYF